jgi:hypothetical protein
MVVFSDVCGLILQSEDVEERKLEIQQGLEPSDQVILTKVVSSLSSYVLNDPENEYGALLANESSLLVDAKNESGFAKFKLACQSLLRAVSSETHPIVLFLDDVQWLDRGSRQLLDMMLQDYQLKNILFVLAYRDEDEGVEMIQELLASCATSRPEWYQRRVIHIPIKDLDEDGVLTMISSKLAGSSCCEQHFSSLSNLVSLKTKGGFLCIVVRIHRSAFCKTHSAVFLPSFLPSVPCHQCHFQRPTTTTTIR